MSQPPAFNLKYSLLDCAASSPPSNLLMMQEVIVLGLLIPLRGKHSVPHFRRARSPLLICRMRCATTTAGGGNPGRSPPQPSPALWPAACHCSSNTPRQGSLTMENATFGALGATPLKEACSASIASLVALFSLQLFAVRNLSHMKINSPCLPINILHFLDDYTPQGSTLVTEMGCSHLLNWHVTMKPWEPSAMASAAR